MNGKRTWNLDKHGNPRQRWYRNGCYHTRCGKIVFRKMRYSNFLDAMLACRNTDRDNCRPPEKRACLMVYCCPICGYAHVGRAPKGTVLMYGGYNYTLGENCV